MGCGSSKAGIGSPPQRQSVPLTAISAPQGALQLIPRPERDYYGRPVSHEEFQIDRDSLISGLGHVATYLRSKNVNVRLVAVGGAVNTIFLRTREATHDVDFFSASGIANPSQLGNILVDASRYAQDQSSTPLGGNWLNNSTVLLMPQRVQLEITELAIKQNVAIFDRPGLKVLAAPWSYAFCGKTDRLCEAERRAYDCQDAVAYLREYIRSHGGQPVKVDAIFRWASHFSKNVTLEVLREIDLLYQETHGHHGIIP